MNIIELRIKRRKDGLWIVGCQVRKAYLTELSITISAAKGRLKDRIMALTGMEYGIDYTFKDKAQ